MRYRMPAKNSVIVAAMMLVVPLAGSAAANQTTALSPGQLAPDFRLPWADEDSLGWSGRELSAEIGETPVVLLFYAANWSGGCTKAVCEYRDNLADFKKLDVAVWGVSGDYIFAHREFAKQYRLLFPLFSDHDHKVARLYGVYNEETGFNRRSVFVIDTQRRIRYVDYAYDASDGDDYLALKTAVRELRR